MYLDDLHRAKRLFHGDIKPANVFITKDNDGFLSSDSGTLLPFYSTEADLPFYTIRTVTQKYCSPSHY